MGRIRLMGLIGLMLAVILVGGCSRLSIDREYDETGIVRENIKTYGFFINRANQLRLDRSEDPVSGVRDVIESAIDEDASPGNEALKNLLQMYNLGMAAAK